VAEANTILAHIRSLSQMLSQLHRPYLSFDENDNTHTPRRDKFDASSNNWANIRSLTEDERDQIDLRAKTIISTCATRVRNLERLEQSRPTNLKSRSGPMRLLGSLKAALGSVNASAECLAVHHNGITWYLNRRLAEVSLTQKELQEERIRLQSRRTHTLGRRAILEAANINLHEERNPEQGPSQKNQSDTSSLSSSWFSLSAPSFESGWPSISEATPPSAPPAITIFDEDAASGYQTEISQTQMQVFESENTALLESMESELAAVQRAESRLLEISALQSELVFHLSQQAEVAEQLYDDAITSTSLAERGNTQLRQAAQRAKDSRLYILVFLLGTSFALLFLHFY